MRGNEGSVIMEEDLTYAFQRFVLNPAEREGVDLGVEEVQQSLRECNLSLIGKVVGERIVNFTGIKNFTGHAWGYPRNLKVTELKANLFQFHFETEQDRIKVLMGGPWVMDNQLIVLKEWEEGIEKKMESFNRAFIWVQIWNMPIHWLSRAAGFKVGKIFKSVRDVILPVGGGKNGRHIKIQAEINITDPLPRGTKVSLNGAQHWVEFKYEKCPDFCYKCGIIGHGDKKCSKERSEESERNAEQYGAWMKAGSVMSSPIRNMKSWTPENYGSRDEIVIKSGKYINTHDLGNKELEQGRFGNLEEHPGDGNVIITQEGSLSVTEQQEMKGVDGKSEVGIGTKKDPRKDVCKEKQSTADKENMPKNLIQSVGGQPIDDTMEERIYQDDLGREESWIVRGKINGREQENNNMDIQGARHRGFTRIKRTPMESITNLEIDKTNTGKRKLALLGADSLMMEEVNLIVPRNKVQKTEMTENTGDGKSEANPRMPPFCK